MNKEQPAIIEALRKADESVYVYPRDFGAAIWCYMTDGEVIIFQCMNDLVTYVYFGTPVPRKYCTDEELDDFINGADNFHSIKLELIN